MCEAAHLILYVADQERSRSFYQHVLGIDPQLHVPGMTEFALPGGAVLGLMPEKGIKSLLGEALPDPVCGQGVPRAELYLVLGQADACHARALETGARELSPMQLRGWGQFVAYSLDPDGHVLALARVVEVS